MASVAVSPALHSTTLSLHRGDMAVVLKPTPRLVLNSLNRAENREMVLFGDAIKNLAHFLPQAYLAASTASPEQLAVDHDSLYFTILSCYTAQTLQMRNTLAVSVYRGKASIWIKKMFFGNDTQAWHSCKGGFQITTQDAEALIVDFLQAHMDVLKPYKKKERAVLQPVVVTQLNSLGSMGTGLTGVAAQVAASATLASVTSNATTTTTTTTTTPPM